MTWKSSPKDSCYYLGGLEKETLVILAIHLLKSARGFETDPRSVAANTCSSNVLVVHRGPGAADHVAAMKELDYVFAELF